jgi:hypothetical protein
VPPSPSRDAERELTGEPVQRTATEDTALKQRVRKLAVLG